MTPYAPIKLVSELLDLPLLDSDGKYCGIVDDVEFTWSAGKELKVSALLVGPGAYAGRMPAWAMWLVRQIAGDRVVRVPLDKVVSIRAAVHLDGTAKKLGLAKSDAAAERWIPRAGAL